MNKKVFIIVLSAVTLVFIGIVIYFVNQSNKTKKEMNEIVEMMSFEKEQLEQEFYDFSLEFNNYPVTIQNDSLVKLLEDEKIKVQQLLEELRITKATNARKIAELKRELESVRGVMVHYVAQIDSLNRINTKLQRENTEVRQKYQAATKTVQQLSLEKETLNETVARASKLDITDFEIKTLNAKDRQTRRFSQIATLQFDYSISKNITTQPGIKTLYLRITRPDGEVLTKDPDNLFKFEDKEIAYSSKKEFEYEGEAIDDVIYWKVEEILQAGDYRADFFVDANLIGSFDFVLKK